MQAIILAAGMGKRLKELTQNNTKCMVKVNGVALIDRMLHQIDRKHMSRIVIVVGYEGQKLMDYIAQLDIKTPIVYVENPIYDKTNNIYSLALAKEFLKEDDTILFESDIIFEDSVLDILIDDERPTLALVDKYERWMDGTCVTLNSEDEIVEFVPGKQFDYSRKEQYYKTVNIYKFAKHFAVTRYVPFLDAYQQALGVNEYYEQVLRVITLLDDAEIRAKRLCGQMWYEIDDAQDLDIAESMFANSDEERLARMHSRYGGFWRYPSLKDFCYLVNPYFPPKKLIEEMKASFEDLLTQYPSGMNVNALVAAKNFAVSPKNIVVGNGAAELIKSLLGSFKGSLGVIRPTFEEYPNRYDSNKTICYTPGNDDYRYTEEDLISFFSDNPVDNLILINPDNPTGNFICKNGLLKLISWSAERKMKLVIDESFVDFADGEDNSIINMDILTDYPHLYVMKSISKSYGVPGVRLGIMCSGDVETIERMKKDVAIWNINSFGEYYLQIAEKYKKNYISAIEKFKAERLRYTGELSKISGIRVIPTQANYVMVELTNGCTSAQITRKLLIDYNILIKDLTSKIKDENRQYLRLAVKSEKDNNELLSALRKEFE